MKKTLSVLLTFALVLSLVPAFAVHFSAKSVGAWQYDVKNGTAVVTDYYGDVEGSVVVPSTLGGYTVTVIGDSAFFNRSAMTGITLPDSVTDTRKCDEYRSGCIFRLSLSRKHYG